MFNRFFKKNNEKQKKIKTFRDVRKQRKKMF